MHLPFCLLNSYMSFYFKGEMWMWMYLFINIYVSTIFYFLVDRIHLLLLLTQPVSPTITFNASVMEEVNGTCLVPFIILFFFTLCFIVLGTWFCFHRFQFCWWMRDLYDYGFFMPTLFILSVCFWNFCAIHACYMLGCLLIFANCTNILLGLVYEFLK